MTSRPYNIMMDNDTFSTLDDTLNSLNSEIGKIREEINNLQHKRRLLSASLLSSQNVRQLVEATSNSKTAASTSTAVVRKEVSALMEDAHKHRETNYHRIAFSTTTFPWKDPNPYSESPNLLGIRIDVCERSGTFAKPYYVLLQRAKEDDASSSTRIPSERKYSLNLSVYRHTIPPFIPMEKLAHRYLPQPWASRKRGTGDDEIESVKARANMRKQDLPTFVRQLRKELAAWHARRDSISWLQERLGVTSANDKEGGDKGDMSEENVIERQRRNQAALLASLAATSLECRYVRLEWKDGRVGRFKISNSGLVERAVVIGDSGRDKKTEMVLMGGDRRIESLVDRLLTT